MNTDPQTIASQIMRQMEAAWNAADGTAFAAPFADDADFVTVRGEHFRGRIGIGKGHDGIFNSIYKNSVVHYDLMQARALSPDVLLAHVAASLQIPGGAIAGKHGAVWSMVIVQEDKGWCIAGFHNTFVTG